METLVQTDIDQLFQQQRSFAPSLRHTSAKERLAKLQRIGDYLRKEENRTALVAALDKDLRKPESETSSSELGVVFQNINYIRKHLKAWMRPKKVATPTMLLGTRSYLHYEPKGVCLVIAPWNYPFNLAILPVLYAIAAGNTIILKPSEISAHTSAYIKTMLSSLFSEEEVAVVEGAVDISTALLEKPFNHIFFTGSPQVGKIVMKAASQHLASVTLELGGKSPAIVDETVNLDNVAMDTVWAKCLNAGQTCIAPDYLLVQESVKDQFVAAYAKAVSKLYNPDGKGVEASPDLARIISDKHFFRIKDLMDEAIAAGAQVAVGGETDEATRYIAPTLLTDVTEEMRIMDEEIFGLVMPLMTYRNADDILRIVNSRPKPLSLYIQSKRPAFVKQIIQHTSAGGTNVNTYLMGYSNPNLPFGGVNNSGIGKSLGYHGFIEFSNERGVIQRDFGNIRFLFPPYKAQMVKIQDWLFRNL